MIKIEVDIIRAVAGEVPPITIAREIRDAVQSRANNGWTLRAQVYIESRLFLTFARKEKGEIK